jgi:ornithine cyclodeaminase
VLHLADSAVAALVDPASADAAVHDAFAAWGRGEAATTQRSRAAAGPAMASAMAAVVPPYSGGKVYATARDAGGHARFSFVNVLFHTDGTVLATLDGDAVTALRTPAMSAVAIEHLAAPGASVATLIGSGHAAWPHAEMLGRAVPHLAELRLCSRPGSVTLAALAARATAAGLPARVVTDCSAAVDGAHIVVTVTSSATPLFPAAAVADHALICAVGATKYDRAEIEPDLVARCAAVVCDDVAGSRVECGDLIAAAAAGRFDWSRAVELSAVAAGIVTVPRAGPAPVLFETQGVALVDVAVSALAYERAIAAAAPVPSTTEPRNGVIVR